jgi:hypothetical protein
MRYFLDCEFNGFGGDVISLALVGEDGRELYLVAPPTAPTDWVRDNVVPQLFNAPTNVTIETPANEFSLHIRGFLMDDPAPIITADWPEDIAHFCNAMIVTPGSVICLPTLRFDLIALDSPIPPLDSSKQHNALWDARSLRKQFAAD